ncbi:MAG: amidohydrolase family protein [Spirochaetales bacterium]|nr:amidohydrolase family protein [Spirochaetales bacterium]
MVCIINGTIHDAVSDKPYVSDILIDDGKILEIGRGISTGGCEVIDAKGLDIFPGFVDAHTHIGIFGCTTGAKDDVEKTASCTPENRIIDAIDPFSIGFEYARRGGVTTVCITPGSVNVIGGTAAVLKTCGRRVDDMIVRNPAAMKIAFGENPKAKLNSAMTTRMTVVSLLRKQLTKAREYLERRGSVPVDVSMEALVPVLKKEIPLKAHAHSSQDIFAAIRLAEEFDVNLTLEHVSDGGLIADILAKEGYPICAGPYAGQPQKEENRNSDPRNAVRMIKAGCDVCVMTDSILLREDMLTVQAGMLLREGLSEFEALKAITINAARHLGVDDRVGSIEKGKDADLVIAKGNPIRMGQIAKVLINGNVCYSME